MGHFAKVLDGKVIQVMSAEPEFFKTFADSSPGEWIQTSYNTIGGQHRLGGVPLRKNYAGIGYTYDKNRDAFIPPQIYPSWKLNERTCWWEPPYAMPTHTSGNENKMYVWDEPTTSWKEVE